MEAKDGNQRGSKTGVPDTGKDRNQRGSKTGVPDTGKDRNQRGSKTGAPDTGKRWTLKFSEVSKVKIFKPKTASFRTPQVDKERPTHPPNPQHSV